MTRTSCVKLVHTRTRGHCYYLIMSLLFTSKCFKQDIDTLRKNKMQILIEHGVHSVDLCQACVHADTHTLLDNVTAFYPLLKSSRLN